MRRPHGAENDARITLARAALAHIEEVDEADRLDKRTLEQVRSIYELRLSGLAVHREDERDGNRLAVAQEAREVRREIIVAERRRLGQLRREGELSLAAARRIERELGLEESRLGGGPPPGRRRPA